jgi:hypothetical protein
MNTFAAAFGSWWGGLVSGVVVGHFFGNAIWQFVKHGTVNAYQAVKHKLVG